MEEVHHRLMGFISYFEWLLFRVTYLSQNFGIPIGNTPQKIIVIQIIKKKTFTKSRIWHKKRWNKGRSVSTPFFVAYPAKKVWKNVICSICTRSFFQYVALKAYIQETKQILNNNNKKTVTNLNNLKNLFKQQKIFWYRAREYT